MQQRFEAEAGPDYPTAIVNRKAGSRAFRDTYQRWKADYKSRADVIECSPSRVRDTLREILEDRPSRIAVGGGDGTLNAAMKPVVESGVEFVALPMGTLNHFAKDLGIPSDPREWNALLASNSIRLLDLGEANGRLFLNNISLGIYPRLLQARGELPEERQLGSKRLASLWAAWQLRWRKLPRLEVRWEKGENGADEADSNVTAALFVSNNRYAETPMKPAHRPRLDAGELVMYIPREISLASVVSMFEYSMRGALEECPDIQMESSQTLTLHFHKRRQRAAIDGELTRVSSPLLLRSRAAQLRAVVPESEEQVPS